MSNVINLGEKKAERMLNYNLENGGGSFIIPMGLDEYVIAPVDHLIEAVEYISSLDPDEIKPYKMSVQKSLAKNETVVFASKANTEEFQEYAADLLIMTAIEIHTGKKDINDIKVFDSYEEVKKSIT